MRDAPRPNLAPRAHLRRAGSRITLRYALRFLCLASLLAACTAGGLLVLLFVFFESPVGAFIIFLFGIPVLWGWSLLGADLRAQLRPPPPGDPAALPPAFHTLSPALQRLVRHTRSLRAVIADPELEPSAVDGIMFEWLTAVSEVPDDDLYVLVERHLDPASVRPHVLAMHDADDPRGTAVDLLDRFVVILVGARPDPYRGGLRRAVADRPRDTC